MRFPAFCLCLLFAPPAWADVWTFETPSRNIQCSVGEGRDGSDLSCTIVNRQGPPAMPQPAGCGHPWGHVFFMLNRGPARVVCEPIYDSPGAQDTAEYGVTGRFGGFTCLSSTSGLRCVNEDGHGFFLSRRSQSVF
ncbi:MAG: DUF6636 domain-containing protein [Pseudooceanicola sp.]